MQTRFRLSQITYSVTSKEEGYMAQVLNAGTVGQPVRVYTALAMRPAYQAYAILLIGLAMLPIMNER